MPAGGCLPQQQACCSTGRQLVVRPVAYSGKRNRRKQAKVPGLFEVLVCTPPRTSLGVHELHPLTATGDMLELDDQDYVVSSVVLNYKLVSGRYQRDHNRLEVQKTGRWLLNQHLQQMLDSPS